eukprot:5840257-Ditylum_brightwellii.AAC.1
MDGIFMGDNPSINKSEGRLQFERSITESTVLPSIQDNEGHISVVVGSIPSVGRPSTDRRMEHHQTSYQSLCD